MCQGMHTACGNSERSLGDSQQGRRTSVPLKLLCIGMQLLHTAVFVSAVRQSEPAIHTLFTGCPSHLGSIPWVTEWPLVSQVSYTGHH